MMRSPAEDKHVDSQDTQEVEHRSSPHVAVVHETVRKEGEEELARAPSALVWSGLAAGLSMGFSLLLGALVFAWVLSEAPSFDLPTRQAFMEIGREAYRGVFVIVSYLIGAGHLDHSIAGSVEVLYLVMTEEVTFGAYLARFLAPALLGNVVGGGVLVALLNHAQVTASGRSE